MNVIFFPLISCFIRAINPGREKRNKERNRKKLDEFKRKHPDPRNLTGIQTENFAKCLSGMAENELSEDDNRYIKEHVEMRREIAKMAREAGQKIKKSLLDAFPDWLYIKRLVDDEPDIVKRIALVRGAISGWEANKVIAGNDRWAELRSREVIPKLKAMLSHLETEKSIMESLADNPAVDNPPASKIHLSDKKGMKIDYIRVINCLCELGFFKDNKGNDVTKKDVFAVFGTAVNKDLSSHQNDLSATKNAANSDLASVTKIFQTMLDKQNELNNKK